MLPDNLWTLTPELAGLQATPYADALRCMAQSIRLDRLFHSRLHGAGHISRVMVLGALLAQRAQLDENVTQLLMYACAYHDVGRVDDSVDDEHGLRAALQVEELTGLSGQPLHCLQAAVEAHSRPDERMGDVLTKYGVADVAYAWPLAKLLKDADGLDRVRLDMLDPSYLRHAFTPPLENTAWVLWRHYPKGVL
ncbi:MAG TPA: HD domain-containing protein [Clostridiales bacterium]|nr:HD domain-containing protein [Clostridiales bacterium]